MAQTSIRVRDLWRDCSHIPGNPPEEPKVSVILPTYRRAPSGLLQKAVQSVLRQTFRQYELILIDDGSTDGTAEYLLSETARDKRIHYYRFKKNSGLPAAAVNFAAMRAKAPILAFMFDDDLWYPNALNDLYQEITKPGRDVVYGKVRLFYRGSASGAEQWTPLGDSPVSRPALLRRNFVSNNAVMLRKGIFDNVGMYDPHVIIRRLTDWDLWRRITQRYSMFQVNRWIGEVRGPATRDSLGVTVKSNWDIMAKYMTIERSDLLSPSVIDDFVVNDTTFLDSNFSAADTPAINEILREYYVQAGDRANLALVQAELEKAPTTIPHGQAKLRLMLSRLIFDGLPQIYFLNYLESKTFARKYSYRLAGELETKFVDLLGCDVLILVRTITPESVRNLRIAKRLGRGVIYFVDDNFLRLSEDFDSQTVKALLGDKEALKNFKTLVSLADVVVVPTEAMASELAHLARNVFVLPPNIPEEYLRNGTSKESEKVKIGHVGTGYRTKEFQLLHSSLKKVEERLSGSVEFEFWGFDLSTIAKSGFPYKYQPFDVDYKRYLRRLRSAGFDILLTPLLDTRYRNCKTPIKYLETAVAGAAGIYSNTPVFNQTVADGQTGLLVDNVPEKWVDAILRLAEDRDLREKIVERSRQDIALNHTTEATSERFSKLVDRFSDRGAMTSSDLLLRIGELIEDEPNLLTGSDLIGNFPGAKLVGAGKALRPIEMMLICADRICEVGGRLLRMRSS